MIFNNLNEFLDYKTNCPFCNKKLIPFVWCHFKTAIPMPAEVNEKSFKFKFKSKLDYRELDNNVSYSNSTSIEYDIEMSRTTNQVIYNYSSKFGAVDQNSFITEFNKSWVGIINCCICNNNYSYSINPIKLTDIINKGIFVCQFAALCENFINGKYNCFNMFGDNEMVIYNNETKGSPIVSNIYDLSLESTKNIDEKIKTLILFS